MLPSAVSVAFYQGPYFALRLQVSKPAPECRGINMLNSLESSRSSTEVKEGFFDADWILCLYLQVFSWLKVFVIAALSYAWTFMPILIPVRAEPSELLP